MSSGAVIVQQRQKKASTVHTDDAPEHQAANLKMNRKLDRTRQGEERERDTKC